MVILRLILASLLLAAQAPVAGVEGRYRLVGGPDVAAQLELLADGRFLYMLSAGALDEHAQGRWRRDGQTLHLDTDPKPRPPAFAAGDQARDPGSPLSILVTWPDGRGIAGVDLRVGFDDGDAVEAYTQTYGWTLSPDEKRAPRWIEFAVPMHALASQRFAIDIKKANRRSFILTPNDLGLVDFRALPLTIEPDGLIMHRGGGALRFERVGETKR